MVMFGKILILVCIQVAFWQSEAGFLKRDKNAAATSPLISKSEAKSFFKHHRSRRSARSDLANECCDETCSWEERAEVSESHGWKAVHDNLCDLSIGEGRNCRCKTKSGYTTKCDGTCRPRICSCPNGGTKSDKMWQFISIKYNIPYGSVSEKVIDAGDHHVDSLKSSSTGGTEFTLSKATTETESFKQTHGTSFSIGTKITASIPKVVGLEVSTTSTVSSSWEQGRTKSLSVKRVATFTCPGKPHKYVRCKGVISEYVADIPYTMTIRNKHYGCTCTSSGTFRKVAHSKIHLKIEEFNKKP